MRVLAACLLALFVAPVLVEAADDAAMPSFVEGPRLSAINSAGVAGSNNVQGGVLIFDSFTGAVTLTTTTGSPRTFMGDSFTVPSGMGTTVQVDEATLFLASTAAQSYSNGLVIRVQFWDDYDGSSASAIFSNAIGGVQTFTVPGPVNLAANTFSQIDVTFAPPIILNGLTNGIDINYQGDNGAGPTSIDTLTSLIRAQPEPGSGVLAVGTFATSGTFASPNWGFYRNAGNQTNFNHPNTDLRTFAGQDDILLALQLRGVLTPVELTAFSVD